MATRVTLPNGVILEGEGAEFRKTLESLGIDKIDDGIHYSSASKGVVAIKDMAPPWLKNSICKMYRDWAADLSEVKDLKEFVRRLHNGPSSKTMMGLIKELATRK
jgi:hypothetical protein